MQNSSNAENPIDMNVVERLAESEGRFIILAELFSEAIFISCEGKIVFLNAIAAKLLGAESKVELIGRKLDDLIERDEKKKITEILQKLKAGETCSPLEITFSKLDGGKIALGAEANPCKFNGQPAFIITARDISVSKIKSAEHLETEIKYQSLFGKATDAIFLMKDDIFIECNPAAEKVFDCSASEIIGKTLYHFSPASQPDGRESKLKTLEKVNAAAGGEAQSFEWVFQKKDGTQFYNEINLDPVLIKGEWLILAFIRDISKRKEAEQALKESIYKFRTLFEESRDAIYISTREGKFVEINPAAIELFGYQRKEMYGMDVRLIYADAKDRKHFQEAIEKCGFVRDFELKLRRKDGSVIDCLVTAALRFSNDGAILGYHGIIRDITEQKRAEEALRESEKRFQQIIENTQEWIWEVDGDGLYTYSSPIVEKILGYNPDEIVGKKHFYDLFYHEDRENLKRMAFEVFAKRETFREFINRNVHKNGEIMWLSTSGVPLFDNKGNFRGYRGADTDITERKKAEDALRKSEELNQGIVENAPVGIMYLDKKGIIIYENPVMYQITGVPPGEVSIELGKKISEIPNFAQAGGLKLWEKVSAGETVTGVEITYQSMYGLRKILKVHASPQRSLTGEISGAIVMCEDITDFKELEQQFLQSQKMEAVGRLAGGVAHDFNNLLTAIIGNCELAGLLVKENHPLAKNINGIKKAADSATSLTRQLLAFSRKQIMEPKVINLSNVVKDMEQMLKRVIGEDIELVISLAPDLWKTRADLGQIESVIMNLVVNARDAMPGGGLLAIETQNRLLDEEYVKMHAEVVPGQYVMLAVSDTGYGMTDEIKSKAFDPFYTTKDPGKGTGLGLSTVYGIVKQSGGHIWIYSELGKGTIFKIYLPKANADSETVLSKKVDQSMPRGSEKVLVVEDEESVREMTILILKEQGYKVYEAKSAEEAYALCQSMKMDLDLLVSDVILPHMNGPELAELLKKVCPQLKIVFMSAYTENSIVLRKVFKKGMPYLQKPFRPYELAQKVRQVLEK